MHIIEVVSENAYVLFWTDQIKLQSFIYLINGAWINFPLPNKGSLPQQSAASEQP